MKEAVMSATTKEREERFEVFPVGQVRRNGERVYVEVAPPYVPAMKELDGFSHVQVLWWFSEFDDEMYRSVTQSEEAPYEAPVMGVFACRSPVRPNPIGLTTVEMLEVDHEKGRIEIGNIDAIDGTPVLDLKAYYPVCDRVREVRVGWWAAEWPEWMPAEGLGLED
jgi:tRNA-Thr(GGU) m(6)t(6)A37 methyltransferase TsaA